jgi:hypothetical protein
LSLLLVLNILRQEYDPEVVDSSLDFGLGLLEIKQLINELHVGD